MDQQVLTDSLKYGFRISHTEEGWIQPLLDAVNEIDSETAKWKPAPDVASIWEIVAHAIPYTESRLCDFTGDPKPDEPDWPEIADTSPEAWTGLRGRVRSVVGRFQAIMDGPDGNKIASPGRLMDIIVHDAFHAGQIVKLKQMHDSKAPLAATHA